MQELHFDPREQFYVLASDLIVVGANAVSDGNIVQQGLQEDMVITDISHSATSSLYRLNFKISGSQQYYFSQKTRANSLFLGTLPFRLTRPILITGGSGIALDFTDNSGASNTIQVVFIGYKLPLKA